MPFYEYQCGACGHHHEELQKVSDRVLRKCPACGRSALKRLISAPVFRLKGGGWYETDFKNDKEGQRNIAGEKEPAPEKPVEKPADKPADKPAEKPADAKAEAKPAEKPAEKKAEAAARPAAASKRKRTRPKVARRRPTRR